MKILRFKKDERINYGIYENGILKEIKGDLFKEFKISNNTFNLDDVEILSPVEPPNIIAIGLNYQNHATETGHEFPERPVIFLKATTSITGPGSNIIIPAQAPDYVDYEAELAVIIGKKAKNIEAAEVDDYILGYTCANDISARDCQLEIDQQWARGKSFDTFCPIGPWIETELEPDNLRIASILNGEIMQESNTADMIFDIRAIVSYCSKNMTLLPGTVILSGTPEGVGMAREPEVYLKPGDRIEVEIEGIGRLSNDIVAE
ncbi:fumarylacetoacetate hydrolase family protein [Halanaerobiaceae bacterium Z-7014]|uniref:Fumarylacetoacetate hydrolase family protein n=1 Tax=Halonatronomonas betaini TaxID=2778430 RepID=A0A931ATH8_9FIRM|nr:fumarylacetoacetate hydrolase family protein [Halonatronomonas betaini]